LKQSETKDQTRKGAKIKGSNYNFSGDLITKLQNIHDQIENIHLNFETTPFTWIFIVFLKINGWAVKAEDVLAATMESLSIRMHVLRLTSLATVMYAGRYQKRLRPLAIKARGGTE
jgi:hypothetical protein